MKCFSDGDAILKAGSRSHYWTEGSLVQTSVVSTMPGLTMPTRYAE